MTPAEIAAKLTPAQVRALRSPWGVHGSTYTSLRNFERKHGVLLLPLPLNDGWTDLGRAVLAELDKGEKE